MSTHNICFLWRNKKKNITELSPNKILILNNSLCFYVCLLLLFFFFFFFFSLTFTTFWALSAYNKLVIVTFYPAK